MAKPLYFEDVEEGTELPPLEKHPTTRQLVKYAAASGDFYEIHYDKDFAQQNGLETVILHGALKNAFLGQLVTDWIGEHGTLKELSCQYRGMDAPGSPVTAKGKVTRKYEEGGQGYVDCEIWLENAEGKATTPGSAKAILPFRSPRD